MSDGDYGGFVIVPDSLHEAINKKLNAAIAKTPEAERDRDYLYNQLLAFFGKHGFVPDFELEKKPEPQKEGE